MGERRNTIVAIVTLQEKAIQSGGAPVFITRNMEEFQQISKSLEGILDASAHELDQETMIIVAR